jgi:hypothetical protein
MAEKRSRLRSALIGLALALFAAGLLPMASLLTLCVVPALYLGLEDLKAALRQRRGMPTSATLGAPWPTDPA